jgi:hypothetical protein
MLGKQRRVTIASLYECIAKLCQCMCMFVMCVVYVGCQAAIPKQTPLKNRTLGAKGQSQRGERWQLRVSAASASASRNLPRLRG